MPTPERWTQHRNVPLDPAGRMGVFKRLADVPARYRLDAHSDAFEARESATGHPGAPPSILEEYRATGALDAGSERLQADWNRAVRSWRAHTEARGVHYAAASPEDVETWLAGLMDGSAPGTARRNKRSVNTVYNLYFVVLEQFYDWMLWSTEYPHVYNPVLMACAEYPDGAAGAVWTEKIRHRPETGAAR